MLRDKQNGLIINPTKTDRMTTSADISVSNNIGMEGFGTERQVGEDVMKIGLTIQKLRDFQDKTLGMNFEATIDDDLSNFATQLASNKEAWQNDTMLNELKGRFNDRVEMYKQIAQEQGYDSKYVEAYIERAKSKLQTTENNFLVKNLKYQEEQTIDKFFQGQLLGQQTNERYIVGGNYTQGVEGFKTLKSNIDEAIKSGLIDRSKAPTLIKESWKGMLNAYGESLINTGKASTIEQMLKWNFNQFDSYFSNLNTELDGQEFRLGSDEFEVWKNGLRGAASTLNIRNKAEKEKTWLEEQEWKQLCATNPVKAYAQLHEWKAGYQPTLEDIIGINNLKYGTDFKTKEEFQDSGREFVYPDIEITGMDKFYKDPNNSSEAIMVNSYRTANAMVGGMPQEVQDEYFDSVNKGLTYGSLGTKAYFTDPNVKVIRDEIYTPENRQIIDSFKDIKDTSVETMNMYKDDRKGFLNHITFGVFDDDIESGKMEYDPLTGTYMPTVIVGESKKVTLDVGAKYAGISSNASKGDKQAIRFKEDIIKTRTDAIKIAMFKETNGIVTEDLAEAADITEKRYVGQPITALDKNIQQKLMDAFIRENKDFRKELDKKTLSFINAGTSNFTPVDLGKKGIIFAGKDKDSTQTSNMINHFINENDFFVYAPTENGEVEALEIPKSEITVSNKMGSNKIALEYMGKNITDEKGGIQFIDLDKPNLSPNITPKTQTKVIIPTTPVEEKAALNSLNKINSQTETPKFKEQVATIVTPTETKVVTEILDEVSEKSEVVSTNSVFDFIDGIKDKMAYHTLLEIENTKPELKNKMQKILEGPYLNEEPRIEYEPTETMDSTVNKIRKKSKSVYKKWLNAAYKAATGSEMEFTNEDSETDTNIQRILNGANADQKTKTQIDKLKDGVKKAYELWLDAAYKAAIGEEIEINKKTNAEKQLEEVLANPHIDSNSKKILEKIKNKTKTAYETWLDLAFKAAIGEEIEVNKINNTETKERLQKVLEGPFTGEKTKTQIDKLKDGVKIAYDKWLDLAFKAAIGEEIEVDKNREKSKLEEKVGEVIDKTKEVAKSAYNEWLNSAYEAATGSRLDETEITRPYPQPVKTEEIKKEPTKIEEVQKVEEIISVEKDLKAEAEEKLTEIADRKYDKNSPEIGVVPMEIIEQLVEVEKLPKTIKWFINEMKNYNPKSGDKRIKEYHDKVVPKQNLSVTDNWCATSVMSAFIDSGYKLKHKTASSQEVYLNKKAKVPLKDSKAGDVLIFRNRDKNGKRTWTGHASILVYRNDKNLIIVGGNHSVKGEPYEIGFINFKVYKVSEIKKKLSNGDVSIIEI